MKKVLLFCCGMVALVLTSCIEKEPLNMSMNIVHDRGKNLYGVEAANGDEMLAIEYTSLNKVEVEANYCRLIACKADKAELWDLHVDVPDDGSDLMWSTMYSNVPKGKPRMAKLAEGRSMEKACRLGSKYFVIITDYNGKKSVYGSKNQYAPFDNVYATTNGYIFEKDGLFGVNDIPPKYKRVYVIGKGNKTYYLLSQDGKICEVYEYGRKGLKKNSEISVAEVEEFKKHAAHTFSAYSFYGYSEGTPYNVITKFYDKLE